MKGQTGYTLLELLVVLVILSLLVAAVPGMTLPGIDSVRFSGQVQDVSARLSFAHDEAMRTGKSITLQSRDLKRKGLAIAIMNHSSISFFPDGSASGDAITLTQDGRKRTLVIDPITGRVTAQ